MVGISFGIEYPTVGFLSVVSSSWYNVYLNTMNFVIYDRGNSRLLSWKYIWQLQMEISLISSHHGDPLTGQKAMAHSGYQVSNFFMCYLHLNPFAICIQSLMQTLSLSRIMGWILVVLFCKGFTFLSLSDE